MARLYEGTNHTVDNSNYKISIYNFSTNNFLTKYQNIK